MRGKKGSEMIKGVKTILIGEENCDDGKRQHAIFCAKGKLMNIVLPREGGKGAIRARLHTLDGSFPCEIGTPALARFIRKKGIAEENHTFKGYLRTKPLRGGRGFSPEFILRYFDDQDQGLSENEGAFFVSGTLLGVGMSQERPVFGIGIAPDKCDPKTGKKRSSKWTEPFVVWIRGRLPDPGIRPGVYLEVGGYVSQGDLMADSVLVNGDSPWKAAFAKKGAPGKSAPPRGRKSAPKSRKAVKPPTASLPAPRPKKKHSF